MAEEGETTNEFIARLEAVNDTPKHVVKKKQTGPHGEVIVELIEVYGVDTTGTAHELVDTDGFLKTLQSGLAGSIVNGTATFTKTGGGGSGAGRFVVDADDILFLLYGQVTLGAVRAAGAAGTFTAQLLTSGNALLSQIGSLTTPNVSERLVFPSVGTVANATGNTAASNDFRQMAITGGEKLGFELSNMANAETFSVNFRFWSLTGTAPVLEETGGTFA